MSDGAIEASFCERMGAIIEAKRRDKNISQRELGEMIGVHRNTVYRWESGESPVDAWHLMRIADVLGCNHMVLLPSKSFTWGIHLNAFVAERDPPMTQEQVWREQGLEAGYIRRKLRLQGVA